MPRYRATEPILLDGQRLAPGDTFEADATVGEGLVASNAAVLVAEAADAAPAKKTSRTKRPA